MIIGNLMLQYFSAAVSMEKFPSARLEDDRRAVTAEWTETVSFDLNTPRLKYFASQYCAHVSRWSVI